MQELMKIAASIRVRVHISHLDDDEVLGAYDHSTRTIHLSFGLTPFELRSVLAHELAHCLMGDQCSTSANERRAERHAAQMLIAPEDYAAAESIDPSPAAIADELQVTVDIVTAYQEQCLQRLGGRTYGRSWRTGLSGALARQLSS